MKKNKKMYVAIITLIRPLTQDWFYYLGGVGETKEEARTAAERTIPELREQWHGNDITKPSYELSINVYDAGKAPVLL